MCHIVAHGVMGCEESMLRAREDFRSLHVRSQQVIMVVMGMVSMIFQNEIGQQYFTTLNHLAFLLV